MKKYVMRVRLNMKQEHIYLCSQTKDKILGCLEEKRIKEIIFVDTQDTDFLDLLMKENIKITFHGGEIGKKIRIALEKQQNCLDLRRDIEKDENFRNTVGELLGIIP